MQKILLPVDGAHSVKRAIEHIVATKGEQRREIHLLNVQSAVRANYLTPFPVVEMMVKARQRAGEEVLRPVRALLVAQGIDHIVQVLLGDPAETIVRYAAECGCTSILMGTRGMSAIGNLMLGSVAAKVVSRAGVPVTLIKRTSGASRERDVRLSADVRDEERARSADAINGR